MRRNMILGRCWEYGFSFSERLCKDFKVKQTSRHATFDNIISENFDWKEEKTVLLTKPVFLILRQGFPLFLNDLKWACLDS